MTSASKLIALYKRRRTWLVSFVLIDLSRKARLTIIFGAVTIAVGTGIMYVTTYTTKLCVRSFQEYTFEWRFTDGVTMNGQNVTRSLIQQVHIYYFDVMVTDVVRKQVKSTNLGFNVLQE